MGSCSACSALGGSCSACSALGGSRSVRSALVGSPPWWAPGPSAPPWWAPVPSAPPWWAPVPSAPPWWAPVPSAPPWWAPVPSAPPWWAPVPSSPPWLPALLTLPRGGYVTNPVHELLFTHHQRSLIHHIDFHTTQTVTYHPKTTFPIIHCTDDAHTTDCTDRTQLISICTLFIRLGLSLCDRRVLFSVYHSPRDSYSTEPTLLS